MPGIQMERDVKTPTTYWRFAFYPKSFLLSQSDLQSRLHVVTVTEVNQGQPMSAAMYLV